MSIATAALVTRGMKFEEACKMPRKKLEATVKFCFEKGHWSVLEFAHFDFEIQGVSRIFETQFVRNRLSSYEIESGRMDREYEPCDYALENPNECRLEDILRGIEEYEVAMDGLDPQPIPGLHDNRIGDIRFPLSQGIAQTIRVESNLRNLIDRGSVRLCEHAQEEYKLVMQEIKKIVTEIHPMLGGFIRPKCGHQLFCNESGSCGKAPKREDLIKMIQEWRKSA
jgi:thymidylate synthase ThyX